MFVLVLYSENTGPEEKTKSSCACPNSLQIQEFIVDSIYTLTYGFNCRTNELLYIVLKYFSLILWVCERACMCTWHTHENDDKHLKMLVLSCFIQTCTFSLSMECKPHCIRCKPYIKYPVCITLFLPCITNHMIYVLVHTE